MIKNFRQFNESIEDVRQKYIREMNFEVSRKFKPIVDFANHMNDILIGFEDDWGYDYTFKEIYFELGFKPGLNFNLDLTDINYEVSHPSYDLFFLHEGEDIFDECLGSDIYFRINLSNWKKHHIEQFKSRIKSEFPFVKFTDLVNSPHSIKFKISDLK